MADFRRSTQTACGRKVSPTKGTNSCSLVLMGDLRRVGGLANRSSPIRSAWLQTGEAGMLSSGIFLTDFVHTYQNCRPNHYSYTIWYRCTMGVGCDVSLRGSCIWASGRDAKPREKMPGQRERQRVRGRCRHPFETQKWIVGRPWRASILRFNTLLLHVGDYWWNSV